MISLTSVTKRFNSPAGGKAVVDDVTFNAEKGEIIGFLGPNGAGKTTTMRLILGYLAPSQGRIHIDKLDPIEDRIKVLKKIGYLPENNPLYQEMKVDEYLKFVSRLKADKDYRKVASKVGLDDVMTSRVEELSRGYKQRVGLAAAMIGDPEILILDEPTSGLDPLEQERIRELIKSLAEKKTIIFSTHILSEVEDVATKLIIIHKGRLAYDGQKPEGKGEVEKLFKKHVSHT
jgi:ABC-2 type transport system ATP-binding protein